MNEILKPEQIVSEAKVAYKSGLLFNHCQAAEDSGTEGLRVATDRAGCGSSSFFELDLNGFDAVHRRKQAAILTTCLQQKRDILAPETTDASRILEVALRDVYHCFALSFIKEYFVKSPM